MRRVVAYVLLGLALAFLLRTESFLYGRGLDPEEGLSLLQGRALCQGDLPCTRYFDHRPPLLHANFAAAQMLFGERVLSCRLWTAMCVGLGAAFVGLIAQRVLKANAPAIAAMAALVLLSTAIPGLTAAGELLMLPWAALAVLLALESSTRAGRNAWLLAAGAGLSLGVAIMIDLAAIVQFPLVITAMFVLPERVTRTGNASLRRVALVCGATLVPTLLVAIVYGLAGQFGAFLFAAFTYPFRSLANVSLKADVRRQFLTDLKLFLPVLPALAVLVLAIARRSASRPLVVLAGIGIALTFLGAIASGEWSAHHLLALLPAVALAVAVAADFGTRTSRAARWTIGTVIASGIVLIVSDHVRAFPNLRSEHLESLRLSWMVDRYTYPGQLVFAANNDPIVYYVSRTEPATRWIFPGWLGRKEERDRLGVNWEKEIAGILAREPVLIVKRHKGGNWDAKVVRDLENRVRDGYRTQRSARHAAFYLRRGVPAPPLPPDAMP